MKKVSLLLVGAAFLASCGNFGGKADNALQSENDSLKTVLAQRNGELDEMMSTFNEVSEGFRQINAIQDRVNLQSSSAEKSMDARNQIASDIEFIKKKMTENKEQIKKLQALLAKSKNQSKELRKAIENLTQELMDKSKQIEELQAELASKNVKIQELDDAVNALSEQNDMQQETLAAQDAELNTAWFVFGTKKELKEQKILTNTGLFKKGRVLQDKDVNKDYFTQIDIRSTKEIPLYAKKAQLLTNHPAGSYLLEKNNKGEYVLKITNPEEFWSTSKYLVIQVD